MFQSMVASLDKVCLIKQEDAGECYFSPSAPMRRYHEHERTRNQVPANSPARRTAKAIAGCNEPGHKEAIWNVCGTTCIPPSLTLKHTSGCKRNMYSWG